MTVKRDSRGRIRRYKEEYLRDHSSVEDKKDRAGRNSARRSAIKKHGKATLIGKDIDHKDGNPRNNSASNVRIMTIKKNRGRSNKFRGRGNKKN